MKNYKVIELLKSLSEDELKKFERFVSSSYFNNGRNYIPLLRELKKFYPHFNNENLNREFLYKRLYPGRKYNDQVMRNLFTGLFNIGKTFLVLTNIEQNKTTYHTILGDEMQSRTMYKMADESVSEALHYLKTEDGTDKTNFKKLFELKQVERECSIGKNNVKNNIMTLKEESFYFLYYVILEMSRHLEEMTVLNHNYNADFRSHLVYNFIGNLDIDRILRFVKEKSLPERHLLELYCYNIKLQIDIHNEELFEKFRSLFTKNFKLLSRWGKYNLFTCLENACIRLQAVDEERYSRILLDIYEDQIHDGLYNEKEGSPLSQDVFRNIVINALKLREYERTEKFIRDYIIRLPEVSKENMYNFSYALLNFEKHKFEEALNYLIKVKYDTFVFKFDIKVLMLKIYHELNYTEGELSMLDAFKHFILENLSISDYIKSIHLNFVKYLHEIVKIKIGTRNSNASSLQKEIYSSKVRSKEWLLEKTAELVSENINL
jgi:hypothetical protein